MFNKTISAQVTLTETGSFSRNVLQIGNVGVDAPQGYIVKTFVLGVGQSAGLGNSTALLSVVASDVLTISYTASDNGTESRVINNLFVAGGAFNNVQLTNNGDDSVNVAITMV